MYELQPWTLNNGSIQDKYGTSACLPPLQTKQLPVFSVRELTPTTSCNPTVRTCPPGSRSCSCDASVRRMFLATHLRPPQPLSGAGVNTSPRPVFERHAAVAVAVTARLLLETVTKRALRPSPTGLSARADWRHQGALWRRLWRFPLLISGNHHRRGLVGPAYSLCRISGDHSGRLGIHIILISYMRIQY